MELARVNKSSEAVVEVLTEFLPASETERGAGGTSIEGDMAMDPAERCASVLSGLMATKAARWFLQPVTPEEAPDYEEYVSSPMDYGTIKARLEAGQYASPEDFAADVPRMDEADFAKRYNTVPNSRVARRMHQMEQR